MTHYCEGQDIKYEFPSVNKIIIYLEKSDNGFLESCKCFGTHYLEQNLDENYNVISESIKDNPHWRNINEVICSFSPVRRD